MHSRSWLATALTIVSALSMALAADRLWSQAVDLRSLDGEWIFVEDLTEGRALEQQVPPMSSKFSMHIDEKGTAVVLNGHGSGHRDVRMALDGSITEVKAPMTTRNASFMSSLPMVD